MVGEDSCDGVPRVRVLTLPRVDWLSVSGFVRGEDCGFVPTVTERGAPALWRPGWWATEKRLTDGRIMLQARAEKPVYDWPQAWGVGKVHPTRVDICCDIEGFDFVEEHRRLFTMRKSKSANHYKGEVMETLNIGSNASHTNMRLRIYLKSEQCTERDEEHWQMNGWSGGRVWRVEYQANERALPRGLTLPEHTLTIWRDGLSRYRMCKVNPRTYSQQNKAPTHEVWRALGRPEKLTRVKRADAPAREGDEVHVRALERVMVAAGSRLLPRLLDRVQRAVDAVKPRILPCGGSPHGEGKREGEG